MDPYGAHAHGHIQPERPHGIGFEGEEEHGREKKPVLKKVKDKVKKIKDTIGKKTHSHGGHDGHSTASEEEYEDEEVEMEMETDPETHGAPMYESAAAVLVKETGAGAGAGHIDHLNRGHESLPEVLGQAEEDPAAPGSRTRTSAPSDQTKLLPSSAATPGSEVVGDSPIIRSFQSMTVSGEPQAEKEALQPLPRAGMHDQPSPESTLPRRTEDEPKETDEKAPTYTEKLTSTATAAREAAASAATTVYNRVSDAGTAVMGKVQSQTAAGPASSTAEAGGGKATGTGMKDYLLDKLRPGDEDRALSEVISDAMHAKKQEAAAAESDAMHAEKQEAAAAETAPGGDGGGGGGGVVDRIKGAVTSFLGGGTGRVSGSSAPPAAEAADDQVGGSGGERVGTRVQEEDTNKQA